MRRVLFPLSLLLVLAAGTRAQPTALSVNTESREEVRQFFRTIYYASENIPMGWNGNYATGMAGDTAAAYKEATRLRINFYRALVGVPADITFNATYNAKAQQAALLMSVNDALSHTPPPTWTLYSATAAEAALNSNLALGQAGADSISGYVADAGDNNAVVGHRRWLFYPQTLQMGTGDVPGLVRNQNPLRAANAVWVIDTTPGGEFGARRPATRTTAIPYPPAGFVPYPLVWPRWSFTHPGADFSGSTVSMTRGGQNIPTQREILGSNIGEPTLVWIYDNRDSTSLAPHAKPAGDTTYAVNVNNVLINGESKNFAYAVTVFDPEIPSADAVPTSVNGTALPAVGGANGYSVSKPSFASSFDWRTVQLIPTTRRFSAEAGLEGLVATTTTGYEVVQSTTVAAGNRAYRLAHLDPRADQVLLIPGSYLIEGGTSQLTFRSRLAIATDTETARVQISGDDGTSWSDAFSQVGTSPTNTGFPTATENTFVSRTLSLSAYAGRSVSVRFVYSIGFGSAFVPNATNTVGWYIDDVTLTGVQQVSPSDATRVADGSVFTFRPSTAGAIGLQARGVLFGAYPMEWGPIRHVNALVGDVSSSTSYLSNLSVRTRAGSDAQTLIVGFTVSGGAKPVLIRGIGPALTTFGVAGALSDPKLEVFHQTTAVSENDNWLAADATTFDQVGAFRLTPGSRDAALVATLAPNGYTAKVSAASGANGIALVELYDTAGGVGSARIINLSARSQVGAGGDALIAGFNVAGAGSRRLLIRAIGPALASFGVDGALADPKLELFASNGSKIEENDNWDASVRSVFPQIGAFDLTSGSRDAVLLVTLPAGGYTAQVSGVSGGTGVALVEVYEVP